MRLGRQHRRLATLVVATTAAGLSGQVAASAALLGAPLIVSAKVAHVRVQEATLKAKINAGSSNATWEVLVRPSSPRGAESELVAAGIIAPGKSQSVSATADKWEGLFLSAETRYTFTLVVTNRVGNIERNLPFKTKSGPRHE